MSSPIPAPPNDGEFIAARNVYIFILVTFVTLCVTAVVITTRMEAKKQGFRPIETTAPMSFFDKTYMSDDKTDTSQH